MGPPWNMIFPTSNGLVLDRRNVKARSTLAFCSKAGIVMWYHCPAGGTNFIGVCWCHTVEGVCLQGCLGGWFVCTDIWMLESMVSQSNFALYCTVLYWSEVFSVICFIYQCFFSPSPLCCGKHWRTHQIGSFVLPTTPQLFFICSTKRLVCFLEPAQSPVY